MATVPTRVQAFRAEYRAKSIGRLYLGWGHFAFTSLASLAVIGLAASRAHHVRWFEWLVLPLGFVVANVAEYLGHRGPMHRPRPGLGVLYRRHAQEHHHFFTHDAMTYESSRDFKMVLFPPVMLLFFLGGLAAPIALGLFAAVSANAAWLFVCVGMGYFLTYEWLHFAYHLPADTWLGRLPLLGRLRRHHATHHDLAKMARYNFNITFPLCDLLLGTLYRPGRGHHAADPGAEPAEG